MGDGAGGERVAIAPGRTLRFAVWPNEDAGVVFDCNSGDYWVVPEISYRLLAHLAEGPPIDLVALAERVRLEYRPPRDVNEIEVIVEDLVEAKLVAAVRG